MYVSKYVSNKYSFQDIKHPDVSGHAMKPNADNKHTTQLPPSAPNGSKRSASHFGRFTHGTESRYNEY